MLRAYGAEAVKKQLQNCAPGTAQTLLMTDSQLLLEVKSLIKELLRTNMQISEQYLWLQVLQGIADGTAEFSGVVSPQNMAWAASTGLGLAMDVLGSLGKSL